MSLIDSILHAASVLSSSLSNVDPRDLLPHHRRGLQSAFQILERTLSSPSLRSTQHNESTSSADSMLHPLEAPVLSHPEDSLPTNETQGQHDEAEALNVQTPSSSDLQVTPSNQDGVDQQSSRPLLGQLDGVSSFMKSLQRRSKNIHTFARKDVEEAISRRSNWSEQDPRLVDIDISERRTSATGKFRGWLGRYSLAEDYLAWAESTFKRPRGAFLILDEKDADKRGQGHITEYVSLIDLPREKTHKAIRYGLKSISFEQVYGNTGVSVLLCHMFTAFRDLPYSQFRSLAEAIRESAEWSDLAKDKADWLSQCRLIYNEDSAHYRVQLLSRKRPLEVDWTTEQSQYKRKETTNGTSANGDVSSTNATSILRPQVDPNSYRPANNCNDDGQPPPAGDNLWPNFDPWEDLNIFEGFDLWQEDFGSIEDPLFSFAPEEEAGATENVSSEPRDAGLEMSNAFQEDGCGHSSRERVAIPFNSPLFNTSLTQTVC